MFLLIFDFITSLLLGKKHVHQLFSSRAYMKKKRWSIRVATSNQPSHRLDARSGEWQYTRSVPLTVKNESASRSAMAVFER